MNKKVTLSLLSATVFASMAASAFAAPTQGVYMGGSVDKFYKLDDLFNLSAAAKKQFVVDLNAANPDLDFKNLVFVDFDGKGAKFSEILAAGTLPKAKRDLTKADFEGSYVTVNLDGSNGASYDPRNDAVDVPTGDLKVESVSANNLKTVVVNFNKAIDSTTLSATTVKAYIGTSTIPVTVDTDLSDGVTASTVGYKLSSDKKTLTLIFGSKFSQSDSLKLAIDGLKDAEGKALSAYTSTHTVVDTTVPVANEVVLNHAKSFDIKFNEPVDLTVATAQISENIKIDGVAAIATVTPDYANNKLTVALPTALATGSHTITVSGIADFAGFKIAEKSFTVNVTADTVAPAITAGSVISRDKVRVTFSEPLNANGTFTVNGNPATPTLVAGTTNQYDLSGFGNLDLSAIVEVVVKYKGQSDAVGNTVSTEQTFKFNVADDTAAPTVSSQLLTAAGYKNNVTLTFTKSMQATGTITVKDSTGATKATLNVAGLTFKAGSDNKVLELTAAQLGLSSVDAGTYTIVVKDMKDNTVRQNLLPETTLTVTTVDTKAPVVNSKYVLTAGATTATDKVTISFTEAMNTTTLNNISNYSVLIGGAGNFVPVSTIAGAKVDSVAADSKSVTLVVPGASASGTQIQVYAVQDVAGNPVATTTITAANTGGTEALAVDTATATSVNTIKVVMTTPVSVVDPSSFKLTAGGADKFTFANAQIDATDSTKKTVILTVNGSIKPDAEQYTLEETTNSALTKNVYGATLGNTAEGLADKIAPTVVSVESGDTLDADTTVESNQFTLTFSEAIKTSGGNDAADEANILNDVAVKDADGNLLAAADLDIVDWDATNVDGSKVFVVAVKDGVLDNGTNALTVSIPAPRYITDGSSNANLVAITAATSVNVEVLAAPAAPTGVDAVLGTNAGTTKLTGVDSTMEYSTDGTTWNAITGTSVDNIAVDKGETIDVRVKAKDGVSAGAATTLTIDYADIKPAAAPTNPALAQGTNSGTTKLTNVDDTMEYQVDGGTWTAVPAAATSVDNITVTAGKVINVRVKQTATQPASDAKAITVADGDIKA
ncbi:beta strand repeat-containing protein [Brevibacillus agri]|uniref:beta strand repeat-containing protein n=1 Tax=Brevibacillus agri TaxID=51101 RepID=UPI0018CEFCF2|nr:hypothetical protein [Brevibacillus agri]